MSFRFCKTGCNIQQASHFKFKNIIPSLRKKSEMATESQMDVASMRKPYRRKSCGFSESDLVAKEPVGQFKNWFEEACTIPEIYEPNAMCLATATKNGIPSARMVLLKGYSKQGFDFYTNYYSRKGKELDDNPHAALAFYWDYLKRGVRIEGTVEKIGSEESTSYFHSRPVESQWAAAASLQSSVIKSRQEFLSKFEEVATKYANQQVPKPDIWGGYRVVPHAIEFWQGQSNRAHDRIKFRKLENGEQIDGECTHPGEDGWVYERLSP